MTLSTAIQANVDAVNKSITAKAGSTNSSGTQGTATSLASLSTNFTNFISLLTTQLKNQDPTAPMETNQFTQELIGFSQVQQSVDTNTNLTNLINLTKSAGVNNSINYLNQLVDANTDGFSMKDGKPTPTLGYTLPVNTTETVISIIDSAGRVVKAIAGSTAAGQHTVTWDGKDASGALLQPGDYKIAVAAKDDKNVNITGITTDVTDFVSQVGYANGVSTLYFGDLPLTTDKVISVKGYYGQATVPAQTPTGT